MARYGAMAFQRGSQAKCAIEIGCGRTAKIEFWKTPTSRIWTYLEIRIKSAFSIGRAPPPEIGRAPPIENAGLRPHFRRDDAR